MARAVLLPAGVVVAVLLIMPFSSVALTHQDFCVADLSLPETPSGYQCKPPSNVTADDFYFHGLAAPGEDLELFGLAFTLAFVDKYPAMNGMGLSAARVDFKPGGVIALHTHPRANEFIFVLDGTIEVGFISAKLNAVFTKVLGKGDMFIFPQGLLHFQFNAGEGEATATELAVFGSHDPGLQVVDWALFSSNLPTSTVAKATFLSEAEVRRLKAVFNGIG